MSAPVNPEPDVNTYSATFLNSKNKKIFCKYWEPAQKPRALVFICHGFAEHCLPYDPLSRALAARGFFVFTHDHIGHGQSGGSRVHIETFQHYVQDVFQHVDMIKSKFPETPIFICGHSMGGAISILSALRRPEEFKGIVLVAPAVVTNPEIVTPFKMAAARFLRWFFPHFPIGVLDYKVACSCPNGVKIIEEDPLRWHGYVKAGFGACLVDAMKEIQDKIPSVTFPFLMLQGEEDKICDPIGAKVMYEKSSSKDKTIKMYPKAYHCLFFEPDGIAEQVIDDIVEWLNVRA